MPIDPETTHTLAEHRQLFANEGVISICIGVFGGTITTIVSISRRRIPFGWRLLIYWIGKVCFGVVATYLAVLSTPIFGLGRDVRTVEIVAILASLLGYEFIGILMRRVLGVQHLPPDWDTTLNPQAPPAEANKQGADQGE